MRYLLIIWMIAPALACAQVNLKDGKDLAADSTITYITVLSDGPVMFKNTLSFSVNYGEIKSAKIVDSNGQPYPFKNIVNVINYFDKNGWDLFTLNVLDPSNTINRGDVAPTDYLIFRRK